MSDNPWDPPDPYNDQTPSNPDWTNTPTDPDPTAGYGASIAQWYRQYLGREAGAGEIEGWLKGGVPIQQIENAIRSSDEAKQYAAKQGAGPATPPAGPGGGPSPNMGGLIAPFGVPFAPPTNTPYPNAPTFTPPSMADAANDPGYIFTLNQGKKNLEGWLAAHGTFNDSSAAEALQDYGQGAASTQYNNVWGRAFQAYEGALQPWQTEMSTTQHDNDMAWQNSFNNWLQQWNIFKDQRDSTFNKKYQVATA